MLAGGGLAAGGHFLADLLERGGVEEAGGQGEEVGVFDADVVAVDVAKLGEGLLELAAVGRREGCGEPVPAQPLHGVVEGLDAGVVVLEGGDGAGGLGVAGDAGEEGLFLVLGVLGRGLVEVVEGGPEGRAVLRGEVVGGFVGDDDQDLEEALDTAMAVAEEAQGLVEAVLVRKNLHDLLNRRGGCEILFHQVEPAGGGAQGEVAVGSHQDEAARRGSVDEGDFPGGVDQVLGDAVDLDSG